MHYRELTPPPSLAALARCVWVLEDAAARAGTTPERILPDGCVELVLHWGSPFARRRDDGRAELQPRAVLAGQLRAALRVEPTGPIAMLGVRLHPWAARAIVGEPLDALTGAVAPLDDLWGRDARELLERIAHARDDDARLAPVAAALRQRSEAHRARASANAAGTASRRELAAAVELIESSGGRIAVGEIAARLGWSRRRLERRFGADVGLGPKAFARVVRFGRVVRALGVAPALPARREAPPDPARPGRRLTELARDSVRPGRRLADLALDLGYADQAHMAREFGELAGLSMTAFRREQHPLSDCFTATGAGGEIGTPGSPFAP